MEADDEKKKLKMKKYHARAPIWHIDEAPLVSGSASPSQKQLDIKQFSR
jgi:hypothetical protein